MNHELLRGSLDGTVRMLRPDAANAEYVPAQNRAALLHSLHYGTLGLAGETSPRLAEAAWWAGIPTGYDPTAASGVADAPGTGLQRGPAASAADVVVASGTGIRPGAGGRGRRRLQRGALREHRHLNKEAVLDRVYQRKQQRLDAEMRRRSELDDEYGGGAGDWDH